MQIQSRPELEDIKPFFHWDSFVVKCEADLATAAQAVKDVHMRIKAIKEWHQEVVGPIKKGIAAFEERLRHPRQALERLEATIKGSMERYWDSQREAVRLAAEEKRKAEIAAAKQLADENMATAIATGSESAKEAALNFDREAERLETKPLNVSQTVRTGSATIAQQLVWVWEVSDLSLVPREYLVIDEKLINAFAKNYSKLPTTIPGITFKQVSRAAAVR